MAKVVDIKIAIYETLEFESNQAMIEWCEKNMHLSPWEVVGIYGEHKLKVRNIVEHSSDEAVNALSQLKNYIPISKKEKVSMAKKANEFFDQGQTTVTDSDIQDFRDYMRETHNVLGFDEIVNEHGLVHVKRWGSATKVRYLNRMGEVSNVDLPDILEALEYVDARGIKGAMMQLANSTSWTDVDDFMKKGREMFAPTEERGTTL